MNHKKKNLQKVLEEQARSQFSGRVNILFKDTGRFKGVLFFYTGKIVNARFDGLRGKKALKKMCLEIDFPSSCEYKAVVEPEVIDESDKNLELSVSQLINLQKEMVQRKNEVDRLRPPNSLKLLVRPDFIKRGDDVSKQEFVLLGTISDYALVGDIYEHSEMLEYETTRALVSLRKKNALQVIK